MLLCAPNYPHPPYCTSWISPACQRKPCIDLDFDKDGFLWISTGNGLCRYDGVNLDVLRNDPRDTASLPNNTVGRCLLLPDGRLLAGTHAGLAVVDTREMTVARIAAPKAWSKGSCTEVAGLTLDARGRVWICDRDPGFASLPSGNEQRRADLS
jgi:ligand-binding sensor domain-containing protein